MPLPVKDPTQGAYYESFHTWLRTVAGKMGVRISAAPVSSFELAQMFHDEINEKIRAAIKNKQIQLLRQRERKMRKDVKDFKADVIEQVELIREQYGNTPNTDNDMDTVTPPSDAVVPDLQTLPSNDEIGRAHV